jgi:hypothetical protein
MRGVYFLSSDSMLDLTIAFLNSFRAHNPELPLCFVPHNTSSEDVAALAGEYNFSVWSDLFLLKHCDAISARFHGEPAGHYRKLALWEGHFDEFIYIDVDTVVLRSLDFVYQFLVDYDFVTSHSHIPSIRKFVWRDSAVGHVSAAHLAYSANTGFIASRRHALRIEEIGPRVDEAVSLAHHMELMCAEQPLLNYLIVSSGKRYTSLRQISKVSGLYNIPLERWGGNFKGAIRNGTVEVLPLPLLVHWAGIWREQRHLKCDVWNHYRNLRS